MLYYNGDEPGGQALAWFKLQLKTIGMLWDAELPEASLIIIYSGIDALGWLAAPAVVPFATQNTFKQWCEKYILTRLRSPDGGAITSDDLYGARCGILHTSTPLSKSEIKGIARQVFYQFNGKTGINLILNAQQLPIQIDIVSLGISFKEGGIAFLSDLKSDPLSLSAANDRAQHFLRWLTAVP